MAVSIAQGHIVWINGPFCCGRWPDVKIAKKGIIKKFAPGEMAIADSGYRSLRHYFVTPSGYNNLLEREHTVIRARHETVNGAGRYTDLCFGQLRILYIDDSPIIWSWYINPLCRKTFYLKNTFLENDIYTIAYAIIANIATLPHLPDETMGKAYFLQWQKWTKMEKT